MKITIHISNITPPIPTNKYDWEARIDEETGPVGYGTNKWAAIEDLIANMDDDDFEDD
jgi:hypothetical protein